jgi:Zn finger protein HypA/HybF involved in hydrogenase expression
MNWHLEDFILLESVEPGLVFGQVDIVCVECNCPYQAEYDEENDGGYCCPNCGSLNTRSL